MNKMMNGKDVEVINGQEVIEQIIKSKARIKEAVIAISKLQPGIFKDINKMKIIEKKIKDKKILTKNDLDYIVTQLPAYAKYLEIIKYDGIKCLTEDYIRFREELTQGKWLRIRKERSCVILASSTGSSEYQLKSYSGAIRNKFSFSARKNKEEQLIALERLNLLVDGESHYDLVKMFDIEVMIISKTKKDAIIELLRIRNKAGYGLLGITKYRFIKNKDEFIILAELRCAISKFYDIKDYVEKRSGFLSDKGYKATITNYQNVDGKWVDEQPKENYDIKKSDT